MKRKLFSSPVKWVALLMIVVMLLSMVTGIAYADDFGQKNAEIAKEAALSQENAEIAEAIPGKEETENEQDDSDDSSEEPMPDGTYYLNGLAVLAGPFGTEGTDFDGDYTCVYEDDGYRGRGICAEMNNNAGGKYIFLGYKYARSFYGEDGKLRSDLITGLLVYNGENPPTQLEYQGKIYKPVTNLLKDSNGDFNQGAGGASLYLYYTNDGIENGDPVLTWIRGRYPSGKTHSEKYVKKYTADERSDTPDDCLCQDMNEKAGGDYIYLETDYHTHTYVEKTDEAGHPLLECTACSFVKKNHSYKYTNLTDTPGYHEGRCTYDGCTDYFTERHVDIDGDGYCDKCHVHGEAIADDILFDTFYDAWDYALNQNHAVTIYITENVDIGKEKLLPAIDNGADITLKRTSSAGPYSMINAYEEQQFIITDGSLSIETDIVVKSGKLQYLAVARGSDASVRIANAKIDVQSENAKTNCAVISVENGASVIADDGTILIENKGFKATGINLEGKDSSLEISNLNIQGADYGIKAAYSENVTINNGELNAATCALLLTDGAKAALKGGKFIGAECINATDGNVTIDSIKVRGELKSPSTVAELLPKDYGAFILDAAEERYDGIPYRDLTTANYVFDKLSEIGKCNGHAILKVECISDKEHEGHCEYCNMAVVLPHEFDEDGTCMFCGATLENVIPGSDEPGGSGEGGGANDNPQTGDNSVTNIIWYELMFAGAVVIIAGTLLYLRKKKR